MFQGLPSAFFFFLKFSRYPFVEGGAFHGKLVTAVFGIFLKGKPEAIAEFKRLTLESLTLFTITILTH